MDDLISRQAAIDAICRDGVRLERGGALMITISTAKQWAVDLLCDLPSAQLEEMREAGISRYGVAAWLDNMGYTKLAYAVMDKDRFPSVHPEKRTDKHTKMHACDLIYRQAAIDAIRASTSKYTGFMEMEMYTDDDAVEAIINLPSAQPELAQDLPNACTDAISRQAAIDIVNKYKKSHMILWGKPMVGAASIVIELEELPPAQPDKEKISDTLYNIYRNTSPHTSAEGVAAVKYYIREIYREIFGEEGPKWLKK